MKTITIDSKRIKKAMKMCGLTSRDVAELWGITRQGAEYAINHGSPYHAVKLGELLGIDPRKLIVIK